MKRIWKTSRASCRRKRIPPDPLSTLNAKNVNRTYPDGCVLFFRDTAALCLNSVNDQNDQIDHTRNQCRYKHHPQNDGPCNPEAARFRDFSGLRRNKCLWLSHVTPFGSCLDQTETHRHVSLASPWIEKPTTDFGQCKEKVLNTELHPSLKTAFKRLLNQSLRCRRRVIACLCSYLMSETRGFR